MQEEKNAALINAKGAPSLGIYILDSRKGIMYYQRMEVVHMRLTKAEKELICTMCSIAEANHDVAQMNDPVRGEGDYEGWTDADFKLADTIHDKLLDLNGFAKRLANGEGDLGTAARAILKKGESRNLRQ